jgi:hypothetical protein
MAQPLVGHIAQASGSARRLRVPLGDAAQREAALQGTNDNYVETQAQVEKEETMR